MTTEQQWNLRAKMAKEGNDTFYKTSLKYKANPDLQKAYVGMPWSIQDASDSVRPNAQ